MKNINADITRITNIVESAMQDKCYINNFSGSTVDDYQEPVTTSASTLTICGVDVSGGKKRYTDEETLIEIDTIIRLPLDTVISASSTITVSQQNNEVVDVTYNIVDNIKVGHGQLVVSCKKLEI